MKEEPSPQSKAAPTRTVKLDGARCLELRKRCGLTRERLAALSRAHIPISIATIKRAENGLPIYPGSAETLALVLGEPLATLLRDERGPRLAAHKRCPQRPSTPPAVAILPFDAFAESHAEKVIGQEIVEELITRLGDDMFAVMARTPARWFVGSPLEAREAGRLLRARYAVEGSVRVGTNSLRLTARLLDVETGRQVLVKQHETSLTSAETFQQRFVAELEGAIRHHLLAAEAQRAMAEQTVPDAWAALVRGVWHLNRGTPQDSHTARSLFLQALDQDKSLTPAHYWLTATLHRDLLNQWSPSPDETRRTFRQAVLEFQRSAPDDARMCIATALASLAHGDREDATAWLKRALQLSPRSARAHSLYGQTLAMSGQHPAALRELELALNLSPHDPEVWGVTVGIGLTHFAAERYSDAVHWIRRAVRTRPQIPFCYGALAAASSHLGDRRGAALALQRMAERSANVSQKALLPVVSSSLPEIAERYTDGLRQAGLRLR